MLTLGIADGQTSGACVLADGQILSAINEERIVRLKQARGFPWKSIEEALRLAGVEAKDITGVAFSDLRNSLREEIEGWPGWFEARAERGDGWKHLFFPLASRFGGMVPYLPGVQKLYYGLRGPIYAKRVRRIREIMRADFGINAPVQFYHHHLCHATAAYYTSGFDDALVVTLDGGGDGDCGHVYSARDGRLEQLARISSYDSLGNYYAYVTALCGYKAKRHEGKITGLAAHGRPIYRELFESLIGCEDGRLINRGRVLFNRALDRIRTSLPEGWTHEDLAATIQCVSEEIARSFVSYWRNKTGHKNVALAGGLFANVRINEEVLNLDGVQRVFIHPGMGDEGLFVGSALAMQREEAEHRNARLQPRNLPHVYLGSDITETECEQALRQAELTFEQPANCAAHIADLLQKGYVVARAAGRMEYGPRALGNRTIMYRPDDPEVNDWLNELLDRTEFMPFAPACLQEATDQLFENAQGGYDTARFMTITFHCTEEFCEMGRGVVHLDRTARPQLVHQDDNPEFYAIIDEFNKRTGTPAIINTSFNIHEEPIVRTASDAVRAFLSSKLDYLQLGPFIAKGPVGSLGSGVRRRRSEVKAGG